ncbi:PDZ domain-containing protein [Paenibacillus sp. TRM 82003]|nr:PDZ domain-containing protein [Paenibacillus sp. TRM 82003]
MGNWRKALRASWPALLGLAATIAVLFAVPVPYIVYEPGPAASTRPMVQTAKPTAERGAFLLTTVRWTYANVFKYATARLSPHAELYDKEAITRGANRKEYVQRQRLFMRGSHSNALEAAYRELGIPYEVRSEEVVVFGVMEGLSADGLLRPGDRLVSIEGLVIEDGDDLFAALEGKAIGDVVSLTYRRGEGEAEDARLELKPLPDSDPPRPGMGITYGTIQAVAPLDEAHVVNIAAGDIGGPSAGLMFTLEIMNQLTPDDLTRGYIVAGTGEIAPDGTVGRIGGVVHKVVGAERKGAELFFVPTGNAEDARRKANEIGASMTIVPVDTLEQALDYLASLPEKETRTGGR